MSKEPEKVEVSEEDQRAQMIHTFIQEQVDGFKKEILQDFVENAIPIEDVSHVEKLCRKAVGDYGRKIKLDNTALDILMGRIKKVIDDFEFEDFIDEKAEALTAERNERCNPFVRRILAKLIKNSFMCRNDQFYKEVIQTHVRKMFDSITFRYLDETFNAIQMITEKSMRMADLYLYGKDKLDVNFSDIDELIRKGAVEGVYNSEKENEEKTLQVEEDVIEKE